MVFSADPPDENSSHPKLGLRHREWNSTFGPAKSKRVFISPRSCKFSRVVEDWGGGSLTVKYPTRYLVWGVKPAAGADFGILWSFQQRSHDDIVLRVEGAHSAAWREHTRPLREARAWARAPSAAPSLACLLADLYRTSRPTSSNSGSSKIESPTSQTKLSGI